MQLQVAVQDQKATLSGKARGQNLRVTQHHQELTNCAKDTKGKKGLEVVPCNSPTQEEQKFCFWNHIQSSVPQNILQIGSRGLFPLHVPRLVATLDYNLLIPFTDHTSCFLLSGADIWRLVSGLDLSTTILCNLISKQTSQLCLSILKGGTIGNPDLFRVNSTKHNAGGTWQVLNNNFLKKWTCQIHIVPKIGLCTMNPLNECLLTMTVFSRHRWKITGLTSS